MMFAKTLGLSSMYFFFKVVLKPRGYNVDFPSIVLSEKFFLTFIDSPYFYSGLWEDLNFWWHSILFVLLIWAKDLEKPVSFIWEAISFFSGVRLIDAASKLSLMSFIFLLIIWRFSLEWLFFKPILFFLSKVSFIPKMVIVDFCSRWWISSRGKSLSFYR